MPMTDKQALRRAMRARRQSLSASERAAAAERLARRALRSPLLAQARRVAVYLAFDGELDPQPLCDRLRARGVELYLPVIAPLPPMRLWFRRWDAGAPLRANRYGIPEPVATPRLASHQLDVVLTPLTAFDIHGGRLGMGAGFYDRTFAAMRWRGSRPHLAGIAYRWQEVAQVPMDSHDLPLPTIWTD